jgi:hypothetical protein
MAKQTHIILVNRARQIESSAHCGNGADVIVVRVCQQNVIQPPAAIKDGLHDGIGIAAGINQHLLAG